MEGLNAHQQMPILNDTVVELPLKIKTLDTLDSIKCFNNSLQTLERNEKAESISKKKIYIYIYKEEPNGNIRTENNKNF